MPRDPGSHSAVYDGPCHHVCYCNCHDTIAETKCPAATQSIIGTCCDAHCPLCRHRISNMDDHRQTCHAAGGAPCDPVTAPNNDKDD